MGEGAPEQRRIPRVKQGRGHRNFDAYRQGRVREDQASLTARLVPASLLQTSIAGKEDAHILKREILRIKFYFPLYLSD